MKMLLPQQVHKRASTQTEETLGTQADHLGGMSPQLPRCLLRVPHRVAVVAGRVIVVG